MKEDRKEERGKRGRDIRYPIETMQIIADQSKGESEESLTEKM
jgi:hypothetical protein